MTTSDQWIDGRATRRTLGGIGWLALQRLVDAGALTVREVPGSRRRYSRLEVEALAERLTKPSRQALTTATE